ncbi:MAG TPA: hypothetical protein VGD68_18440 [Streptosporangiaceae bacterium]
MAPPPGDWTPRRAPYAGTIEALLNGDHPARQFFDGTPARLYYAAGDEQAVNANTFQCRALAH